MIKRVGPYLLASILLVCLNFALPRLLPGDPLAAIYGAEAMVNLSPELKEQLLVQFGLQDSVGQQFLAYITNLVKGELGYSYYYKIPVSAVIIKALPWTLMLVGVSLLVAVLIGFPLGLVTGWYHSSWLDKALTSALLFLGGFPDFFIGSILLLVFAVKLNWLPLGGATATYGFSAGLGYWADVAVHAFLPILTLVFLNLPNIYLISRSALVGILGAEYLNTARAKGLTDLRILFIHAGKNCLMPMLAYLSTQIGRLVTGALFVELVFSYPGLGGILQAGLLARDYPLVQGILLMVAVTILLTGLLLDSLQEVLDPRVRTCTSTTGNYSKTIN